MAEAISVLLLGGNLLDAWTLVMGDGDHKTGAVTNLSNTPISERARPVRHLIRVWPGRVENGFT